MRGGSVTERKEDDWYWIETKPTWGQRTHIRTENSKKKEEKGAVT